jgi:sialate O-acetylesterase
MKTTKLIILLVFIELITLQFINAEVKLPEIVSSNMVLQRNTTVVLWGWADANENIEIESSWLNEVKKISADNKGTWSVEIVTTNSKEAQTIKITSITSHILLENILFGEVWLCSGQSNMEQPIKGFNGQPTFGATEAITLANNQNLRLFAVRRAGSKTPQYKLKKYTGWQQATPNNISDFSAVAYFFGQQLQTVLNVPVGLIHTSHGGSNVQAWMSKEVMSTYQNVNLDEVNITKNTHKTPTALFNAMINPLIPYTIKGALWYQGEANRNDPENYTKLFPAMVKDWRARWGIGNFPFYYVQIAPYSYGSEKTVNTAFIREAQLQCLDLIPNSGIAITMDVGSAYSIHPPKKKEVADRLLYNALNQTYGYKKVDFASPVYDSFEIEKDHIKLIFKNAKMGLYALDALEGFEIAGADKVFHPAKAKIINRKNILTVSSGDVPNPVAVRYAWKNWIVGTLFNTSLLPAASFRTDDWDDATQANKNRKNDLD